MNVQCLHNTLQYHTIFSIEVYAWSNLTIEWIPFGMKYVFNRDLSVTKWEDYKEMEMTGYSVVPKYLLPLKPWFQDLCPQWRKQWKLESGSHILHFAFLPVIKIRITAQKSNQPVILTYMEFWWLEAEVSKGITQLPLRLHHLGQLTGQRLSQLDYMLVLSLVVAQDFDLSLQLHVHCAGASTQLLWKNLPGALQRRGIFSWTHSHTLIENNEHQGSGRTEQIKEREAYFISVDAPLPDKVQFFHGRILQIIWEDHCSTFWLCTWINKVINVKSHYVIGYARRGVVSKN